MIARAPTRAPGPQAATVPMGERVYAIGDVHGCLELLNRIIDRIDADDTTRPPAATRLILLGDLIDRGHDSAGVVGRARSLAGEPDRRVDVLMGNHEDVFLNAVDGAPGSMDAFLRLGGRQTLLSFGLPPRDCDRMNGDELRQWMADHIPGEVVDWLRARPDHVRIGGYLFAHAGVRPGVPLEEQHASDLRWIRAEFLDDPGDHGAMIVHGHSITPDIDERHNRIGLDTGAHATGLLSAMGFEGDERWPLQVRA